VACAAQRSAADRDLGFCQPSRTAMHDSRSLSNAHASQRQRSCTIIHIRARVCLIDAEMANTSHRSTVLLQCCVSGVSCACGGCLAEVDAAWEDSRRCVSAAAGWACVHCSSCCSASAATPLPAPQPTLLEAMEDGAPLRAAGATTLRTASIAHCARHTAVALPLLVKTAEAGWRS
jgi:hypothetical protein